MSKIEVLVGMIASGKSTYAKKRADEGAMVVCHDDLTGMLHARYTYKHEFRDHYRKMEESLVWTILNAGLDVIIDRTHLTRESRQRWIKWERDVYGSLNTFEGNRPKTPVIAIVFPVDRPEVHARRRFASDSRGRSYDEWLFVAEHHQSQIDLEPVGDTEGFTDIIRIDKYGY